MWRMQREGEDASERNGMCNIHIEGGNMPCLGIWMMARAPGAKGESVIVMGLGVGAADIDRAKLWRLCSP